MLVLNDLRVVDRPEAGGRQHAGDGEHQQQDAAAVARIAPAKPASG